MADRVGQQLGNYRLTRLLGRGAFAEVYLGEQVRLKREAAVKVLRAQLSADATENFSDEARAIAALDHPNILKIYEFGIVGNTAYLAMEYAPNGTLRQRHPRGTRVPLPTIVSYVQQVASALQYVHDHKLIHRNIKPEIMLLGRNNDVLLGGFSIATAISDENEEQTVIGTPAYMAPEQIQGKPQPASDQYALGVVVYEWLSGNPPFQGNLDQVLYQHLSVPPPPLREKVPTISPVVEQVVMTALAKNPNQRFASVRAFADALEQDRQLTTRSQASPTMSALPPHHPTVTGVVGSSLGLTPVQSAGSSLSQPPQSSEATDPNILAYKGLGRPTRPQPPPPRSRGPGLPSFPAGVSDALAKFFSRRGSKKQQETELSLFAIARTTLEVDDRAIVGKVYTVQAGVSQNRPADFRGEPFRVSVQNPAEPILFGILLHPSENIELLGAWYQRLSYDPRNAEPQFISCPFRLKAPGRGYLVINFYRERQWLKIMRFEFDSIEQSILSTATRGR